LGRLGSFLVIAAALLAPLIWEIGVGLTLQLTLRPSELVLLLAAKVGFALLLLPVLALKHRATAADGGAKLAYWPLLWPIWLAAALSAVQGFAETEPLRLAAWLVVAVGVAIGEEGIFRGVILGALDPKRRPRRAVLISSLLFGAIHLAGLAAPIDPRMILAQSVVAFGIGLVFGSTRLLAGSLWPGVAAHALLDFFGIAASGGVGDALSYNADGILYMLVSAAVASLWGLVLMRRLKGGSLAAAV
jgi:membrane protease YdiL (CAAX protease family)